MGKTKMIEQIVDYVEKNLDQEISLDDIAVHAGYSKFYLNRCFQEVVGCTMYKYIRMRRLTEAAGLLAGTEQPIIEIAFAAGYQSQQAFGNAFRAVYVCSPQQYRRQRHFEPQMPRFVRPAAEPGQAAQTLRMAQAEPAVSMLHVAQAIRLTCSMQAQMGGRIAA